MGDTHPEKISTEAAVPSIGIPLLALAVLFLNGLMLVAWLRPLASDSSGAKLDVFHYLYYVNEPPALVLGLAALLVGYLWIRRTPAEAPAPPPPGRRLVWVLALGVFLITVVGTFVVCHDYPLAMDEYLVLWQGEALRAGQVHIPLPAALRPWGPALQPLFVNFDLQAGSWSPGYWPVYALMHGCFAAAGAGEILNPLLSAASVLLIAAIARQLWPAEVSAPFLSALLLATSTQFVITGMTFYSMPAHLFLNLLWLWLYFRTDRVSWLLLPWVGVAALGLHQPFMHALFVVPFLLRILRTRRRYVTAYVAAVYLAGCVGWYLWMFQPLARAAPPTGEAPVVHPWVASAFTWPNEFWILEQNFRLVELLTWQNLAVSVLAGVGLLQLKRLPVALRDLAFSLILSYVFYFFTALTQGQGWGSRYMHGVLGNLVLLAVAGYFALREGHGAALPRRLLVGGTIFALAVQLPLRAWQAETFVRPFARAQAYVESLPEEVVVVYPSEVWYARELVRNDPFLARRPLVLDGDKLTQGELEELRRRYRLRVITTEELREQGMVPWHPQGPARPHPPDSVLEKRLRERK